MFSSFSEISSQISSVLSNERSSFIQMEKEKLWCNMVDIVTYGMLSVQILCDISPDFKY